MERTQSDTVRCSPFLIHAAIASSQSSGMWRVEVGGGLTSWPVRLRTQIPSSSTVTSRVCWSWSWLSRTCRRAGSTVQLEEDLAELAARPVRALGADGPGRYTADLKLASHCILLRVKGSRCPGRGTLVPRGVEKKKAFDAVGMKASQVPGAGSRRTGQLSVAGLVPGTMLPLAEKRTSCRACSHRAIDCAGRRALAPCARDPGRWTFSPASWPPRATSRGFAAPRWFGAVLSNARIGRRAWVSQPRDPRGASHQSPRKE